MAEYGPGVLIVDDEEGIRIGLTRLFSRNGYRVLTTPDPEDAVGLLREHELDAAIVDIRLRNGQGGLELLGRLRSFDPDLVVIMITGYGSIETAVTSMQSGAADYILKPVENDHLLEVVKKNLELRELRCENRYLKGELRNSLYSDQFLTRNPALRQLLATADRIKNTEATVLLTGESGTGKEVLAQYIHFTGDRRERNFVGINCATLSEELLLSELFGHERGSFTGAMERKVGKFEVADRGTLFLDEVAEMSVNVQAKLLRVLEENSFERLGGNRRIRVDVRVIAASNGDLTERIRDGRFREDLYYRLNVIRFELPPLRERPEDITLLADHFLRYYARRYNKGVRAFSPDIRRWMESYPWPGNVRELKNAVNQAVLLAEGEMVFALPQQNAAGRVEPFPGNGSGDGVGEGVPPLDGHETLAGRMQTITRRYESALITESLRRNGGNRSAAARELGVTRKTLRDKMDRYGLS